MYQYFPHKEALLYAVIQRYLNGVAEALERACRKYWGQPIAVISEGLVTAYIDAKTTHAEASRALYRVGAELETDDLLGAITKRFHNATVALLASAPDVRFEDLDDVTFALLAAMTGATRVIFEHGATPSLLRILRSQLAMMCRA